MSGGFKSKLGRNLCFAERYDLIVSGLSAKL